jgi:hypothetical protein
MHKLPALILFICVCGSSFAQNNTVVSGGIGTSTDGSVSYSIGQVHYIHPGGSSGNITEGLQQPIEILASDIKEVPVTFSATLFPNPAGDIIFLQVESSRIRDLKYQLFDLQGKLIAEDVLTDNQTIISVKELTPMTYILKLSNQTESKSFKLIKSM